MSSDLHLFEYSFHEVEKIACWAKRLRRIFELGSADPLPIVDILEFRLPVVLKGFRLVVDCDDQFDECVLATAQIEPPEIIVRESLYRDAIAGSGGACIVLAHELGHLWLSHDGMPSAIAEAEDIVLSLEWQAEEFAAELLMPSEIILLLSARDIADRFQVPLQYAEFRLTTLIARRRHSSKKNSYLCERYSRLSSEDPAGVAKSASARNMAVLVSAPPPGYRTLDDAMERARSKRVARSPA